MSKSSRRARPGSRPPGAPVGADSPGARPADPGPEPRPGTGTASARPAGSRAGRRERARPVAEKPFLERFRVPIVGLVAVAAVALMAVWAFNSASAAAYTCSVEWQAAATPAPSAGTTSEPGYAQEQMGNSHLAGSGAQATYTFCPPASGPHNNVPGRGPIQGRVYGPNDAVVPQGWIHNLEHGGLVVLYRGRDGDPGPSEETQAAIRDFAANMPPSPVCGAPPSQFLVVARFDQMATPFAALVWGRVLPLQTFDTAAIQTFWNTSGEQALTMPERFGCPLPSASPSGTPDASPSPS